MLTLLYALAHALPILIVGHLYPTRKSVLIAAAVMGVVAIALGQIQLAWMDLIGVGAGTWMALRQLRPKGTGGEET